ncbi:MAG: DNA mismatch repair endonuclease MutL [Bacteroidota bacterium]|jgi:DNA mismatch repair protein MutL|nr:DNA mismatch repair endonuclease MutL [Ignavibacteria bacterium]MCU7497908.1 DNA mismatch repair endonuclease MutL [Ignavibacteria bacterium]MCU7511189.1 DNA mismatch repair endonuclease MutL [Ignavibacteria bacterium]MCU7518735.1 DNA mismatch repair endonuclease MutL [Ignavibacteria bacterium]MCU7522862.1 DNA mismatch repair endonuclease MutL [Ignavibacteria bacterium]
MKNKIQILPENIANKIAAGEVVQRPESVIKELLENSIDANAKSIDVVIKRAGKALIQVVDDGDGMTEEDAVLSIQRHATSKIHVYEDLEAIKTLGFRGEALSSIAAVSQLEIKTEMMEDEVGICLKVEDGASVTIEKGSFSKGTSISVKNLFFNTPARRSFMKSDATELKHIIETFKKIALSRPDIAFRFFNDDEVIFDFPSGTRDERIQAIFADNMLDALVEVKELTNFLSVSGYIAKPAYLRKSKGEQYLFINNRFVVSKQVNHAVFHAYENILDKGDYPFFILFMELDPRGIDINVHPSKLEVKFEDEKDVYAFMHAVIKKALGSYDLVPSMTFGTEPGKEKLHFDDFRRTEKNDFEDRPNFQNTSHREEAMPNAPQAMRGSRGSDFSDRDIDMLFNSLNTEIRKTAPGEAVEHPFSQTENREVYHSVSPGRPEDEAQDLKVFSSFIIQLHNKYILSQIKSGLMIIDQHVAHERILYEKALKSFNADLPFSQQLLFSQSITVDAGDYALLKELRPYLTKLGFEIKFFSKNTVVIDGVPQDVKLGTEEKILLEIVDEYKRNQREKHLEERDNLAKSFSCKTAIKAGDRLSEKEMRLLVDQLFATSMPYVCPHGRPIIIKIPLEEFDKRFGRT